eukprot:3754066-Lingulodinium_polyedra.AAC.1
MASRQWRSCCIQPKSAMSSSRRRYPDGSHPRPERRRAKTRSMRRPERGRRPERRRRRGPGEPLCRRCEPARGCSPPPGWPL